MMDGVSGVRRTASGWLEAYVAVCPPFEEVEAIGILTEEALIGLIQQLGLEDVEISVHVERIS